MSDQISNRKAALVQLLRLLASMEDQLAYENNVPHVDITVELQCMWFDDLYHPDDETFRCWFTPEELAALAEFDRVYREQKSSLAPSLGTVRTWLNSPCWWDIMLTARITLAHFGS